MSLVTIAALGAFHGLNPAMGWLFATALGMQERRSAAVLRALPPIAAGHALSVGLVVALLGGARMLLPAEVLRWACAAVLLAFAAALLARRAAHPRGGGMRMGAGQLAGWSFLMATAHGAGLMLLPVLIPASAAPHAHHVAASADLAAVGVHSVAMLGTMAATALVAYGVLGVGFLRRAWINLDAIWIGALVLAAVVTVLA